MTVASKRILKIELLASSNSGNESRDEFATEVYALGTQSTRRLILSSVLTPKRFSRYDLIITNEYFSSFGVNLRLLLTGCRTKHMTIGLNQSRKLLKTRIRWIDKVINAVFRRSALFIVHSRREVDLFHESHQIPKNQFYFSLWGFDFPAITPSRFSKWPRTYICSVGRNNRDFKSFCQACDGFDIDGIIVTSSYESLPENLPANVHVFRELSTNETLDCIRNAAVSVLLLKDSSRGAGHITAVAAMFAETPQIVSNADVLEDYLIDGVSAISVPVGDVAAIRTAIKNVLTRTAWRDELTANARAYASEWLTHRHASGRISVALKALFACQSLATIDPYWLGVYEGVKAKGAASRVARIGSAARVVDTPDTEN